MEDLSTCDPTFHVDVLHNSDAVNDGGKIEVIIQYVMCIRLKLMTKTNCANCAQIVAYFALSSRSQWNSGECDDPEREAHGRNR